LLFEKILYPVLGIIHTIKNRLIFDQNKKTIKINTLNKNKLFFINKLIKKTG